MLSGNNIGDGGAIALAETLKATLVTRFRRVRATLFLWPARTPSHRRRSVICVTSVFRCVARADVFEMLHVRQDVVQLRHARVLLRRLMQLNPSNISGKQRIQNNPLSVRSTLNMLLDVTARTRVEP